MFCKNCGSKLTNDEKFCGKCGTPVADNPQNQPALQQVTEITDEDTTVIAHSNTAPEQPEINKDPITFTQTKHPETSKKTWKNTASIILGVISLLAVFLFQILTMPFSAIGAILGFLSFKENKQNKLGLILNLISFALAVPIFILYSHIFSDLLNPALGFWDCKAYDNTEGPEYIVSMQLDKDGKFTWGKYNDLDDNHVFGTYTIEDLHKTNHGQNAKYYKLILDGDEFMQDGQLQTNKYKSTYELVHFNEADDQIMLMNTTTYNMYYCYKNSTK